MTFKFQQSHIVKNAQFFSFLRYCPFKELGGKGSLDRKIVWDGAGLLIEEF